MNSTQLSFASIAILAATAFTLSVPAPAAAQNTKFNCMTDDGYGRMRPCSADYMAANPNWRDSFACFTDDGYGRQRPCSADYKAPAPAPQK